MISEERIKELAEDLLCHIYDVGFVSETYDEKELSLIKETLHTVAAEARKEGIDEMLEVAKKYSDYSALRAQLDIEAERLKEQGK